MTSKTVVLFYSVAGNTKAIANLFEPYFDVFRINNFDISLLDNYERIIFGTSTWGEGVPPKIFFDIKNELMQLNGKTIGLFGSGNAHFEYFCGALDLLEELLKNKNEIIFKYKYEGYPKQQVFDDFNKLLEELIND